MLLDSLKQYLLTPVCLGCGSFFCNDSLFCNHCFHREIEPNLNLPSVSHLGGSKHFYLLKWNKEESRAIDQMVYRMKSDNSCAAWRFYSRILLATSTINLQNFVGFVPIPGSTAASVHSKIFAEALSSVSGLPIYDLVAKKANVKAQKQGGIQDRKAPNFVPLPHRQSELFTKLIFVDDVLTTGESFLQSNRAVNGHNENVILTLFYRAKA